MDYFCSDRRKNYTGDCEFQMVEKHLSFGGNLLGLIGRWLFALRGLMAGASGSDGGLKTQRYQIVFHMRSFMPAGAGPSSSVFLISEPFEVFPVAPIDEFLIRLAHMNLDWRGFVHPG